MVPEESLKWSGTHPAPRPWVGGQNLMSGVLVVTEPRPQANLSPGILGIRLHPSGTWLALWQGDGGQEMLTLQVIQAQAPYDNSRYGKLLTLNGTQLV